MKPVIEVPKNISLVMRVLHSNVKESKIVLESRFHVMDSGFQALNFSLRWWNLESGLQSLGKFQIPKPMILDSTGKIFPDSGFHKQNFSDFEIQIPLDGAICTWGFTEGLGTAEPVKPANATKQGLNPSMPTNDSARRPATRYSKSRPYSRCPARCLEKKRKSQINLISLWKIPHRSL